MLLFTILQIFLIQSITKISFIFLSTLNNLYASKQIVQYGMVFSNIITVLGRIVGSYLHKKISLINFLRITLVIYGFSLFFFLIKNPAGYLIGKIFHGLIAGLLSYVSVALIKDFNVPKGNLWTYRSIILTLMPSIIPLVLLFINFKVFMVILSICSIVGACFIHKIIPKKVKIVPFNWRNNSFLQAMSLGVFMGIVIRQIIGLNFYFNYFYSYNMASIMKTVFFLSISIAVFIFSKLPFIFNNIIYILFLCNYFLINNIFLRVFLNFLTVILSLNHSLKKNKTPLSFMAIRVATTSLTQFFLMHFGQYDLYVYLFGSILLLSNNFIR